MVSLQSPISPNHRAAISISESENSITPQKRKALEGSDHNHNHNHNHNYRNYNDDFTVVDQDQKRPKAELQNFMMADIELHLETPLPSEWQRCLDIQSGKIHFYNTKTHARTSTDPRNTTSVTSPKNNNNNNNINHHHNMSLDLELNLTSKSNSSNSNSKSLLKSDQLGEKRSNSSPAWLTAEAERRQEMVATVCMRCHMLVMLCRSSPACPNCKFVHPPEKTFSPSFVHVKF